MAISGGSVAANTGLTGDADAIYAGAGNDLVAGGAGDDYINSGDDDDLVFGEGGADVILLGAGNDRAYGDDGSLAYNLAGINADDYIDGGAGSDTLFGSYGNDFLVGGAGIDYLYGDGTLSPQYDGDDTLDGGDGNDYLYGHGGADTLIGGKGNDELYGGYGRDTYVFNRGDGIDAISDEDDVFGAAGSLDKSIIILGEGISRSDVVFKRGSLLIELGQGDQIHLTLPVGQTDPAAGPKMLERLQFADGGVMTWADLLAQGFDIVGTAGNDDPLNGTVAIDRVLGLAGNDKLYGLAGNDTLDGGDGDDRLEGGTGDDLLKGGAGNDTYQMDYAGANGRDVIDDVAGNNILRMQQGLGDLALSRNGNDLVLTVRGASDSVTLKNGFAAGGTTGWTINYGGGAGSIELAKFVGSGALAAATDVTALTTLFDTRWRTYNYPGSTDPALLPPRDTRDAAANTVTVTTSTVLNGAAGNDTLTMNKVASVSYLRGVPGSLLIGGTGDDTLTGGGDDDILTGGTGNNTLDGGNGEDHYVLFAGAGTDTIVDRGGLGLSGNDAAGIARFQAGAGGFDRVYLPSGVNAAGLIYSWSDELVQMERNTHATHSGPGAPTLSAGFPTRVLTAMLSITWGDLSQSVKIAMPHADDPLDFGIEELRFADGSFMTRAQLLSAAAAHDRDPNAAGNTITGDQVDGEAGNDVLSGNGILRGGEGNDSITGGGGRDAITGDEGADTLIGGAGADLLGFGAREFKGAGNTYRGGTGNDMVLGSMNSDVYLFDRGDGADSIGDYWHNPGNSPFAQGLLAFSGQWGDNYADVGTTIASGTDYAGFDTLRLGANIAPSEVAFVRAAGLVYGASAGAPDPSPAAVAAANGDDLVLTMGAGDQVRLVNWYKVVTDGEGPALPGGWNRRALTRVEFADGTVWNQTYLDARSGNSHFIGTSGNDTLTGTAGADYISGLGGNDTLNGGAGADAMEGGTGADTYYVDSIADVVIDVVEGGVPDWIYTSVDFTLPDGVEIMLAIPGSGATLRGNAAVNVFNSSNDGSLNHLYGGDGGDVYYIHGYDVVHELTNQGTDRVVTADDYDLADNVENLEIGGSAVRAGGNALANALTGNGGDNTLIGAGGDDLLFGGGGIDTAQLSGGDGQYIVVIYLGDVYLLDRIPGRDGYDRLSSVEQVRYQTSPVVSLAAVRNPLDYVASNPDLIAVFGIDEGAALTHLMQFGVSEGRSVTFDAGGYLAANADLAALFGADLRAATTHYINTGAAQARNAVFNGGPAWDRLLAGAGNDMLDGGAGNDRLEGRAGNDILQGGTGRDSMDGGLGWDTYYVDNPDDETIESSNEASYDQVFTSIDWVLGTNLEGLTAIGGSSARLTGNAMGNLLKGSDDGGINVLEGLGGNDNYAINTYDVVIEAPDGGIDRVDVWGDYTLPDNVENLRLGGPTSANGIGNALDNTFTGNAFANVLTGKDGSDTYYAGRGGGADTVVETVADGDTDVVQFLTGVATNQIWFRQVASDLEASIIGTSDKVKLQGWYGGGGHAVEQFKTSDGGKTLLESQVQGLVSAMAALSATPPATSTLPTDASYDSLRSMIATNWQ